MIRPVRGEASTQIEPMGDLFDDPVVHITIFTGERTDRGTLIQEDLIQWGGRKFQGGRSGFSWYQIFYYAIKHQISLAEAEELLVSEVGAKGWHRANI